MADENGLPEDVYKRQGEHQPRGIDPGLGNEEDFAHRILRLYRQPIQCASATGCLLYTSGYDVTYAGNGKKAWEQFPEVKPDLVLLDINMPCLLYTSLPLRLLNFQVTVNL